MELHLTGDDEADALLSRNPLALLIGMLLDQQIPMEWAFAGPQRLAERLDGELTAATIAATDPEELEELFRRTPAVHRFPGSMAKRTHALCVRLVEDFGGDAAAVWRDVDTGGELRKRLESLPGFGRQKSQIFVALLGKQCGVTPEGWREAAGHYGEEGYRSVADITSPETLDRVRAWKKQQKGTG